MSFKKNIKFKYIKNSLVLLSVILIVIASPYIVYFSTSKIATIYINKKDYNLAENVCKFGIKFEDLFFNLIGSHRLKLKDTLAKIYIYKENYLNAKKIYLENIEIRQNKYPEQLKEIINNYFQLALISQRLDNKNQEKKYFDKLYDYTIIKNQDKQLFDDIPIISMQEFYKKNNEYDKVLAILEYRHKAKNENLDPDSTRSKLHLYINFAETYGKLGNMERAEVFFQKALSYSKNNINNLQKEDLSFSDLFCDEFTEGKKNCKYFVYFRMYEKYGDFKLNCGKIKEAKHLYLKQIELIERQTQNKQLHEYVKKLKNKIEELKG